MTQQERKFLREFVRQAKKLDTVFIHKEGDTYGGHKKPYDFYMIKSGLHLAIEAKWENEILLDHQRAALVDVERKGEGLTFVARFKHNGDHAHDMHFYYCSWGIEKQPFYVLRWESGVYTDLEDLAYNLIKLAKKSGHKVA